MCVAFIRLCMRTSHLVGTIRQVWSSSKLCTRACQKFGHQRHVGGLDKKLYVQVGHWCPALWPLAEIQWELEIHDKRASTIHGRYILIGSSGTCLKWIFRYFKVGLKSYDRCITCASYVEKKVPNRKYYVNCARLPEERIQYTINYIFRKRYVVGISWDSPTRDRWLSYLSNSN